MPGADAATTDAVRRTIAELTYDVGKVPELLFVCVHNAGRSQVAAALAAHLAPGRVHVRSADVIVTMGCGDSCPALPGKRDEDWSVADPQDSRCRWCARSGTTSSTG